MPIPAEFNYKNEKEFTEKLVVPLLGRIGFSVVLNYHGTMEFGKDLIVGEFDKFSHVRYCGIQVKYQPSISLSDSHDLIRDCEQAFNNSFTHPHTGEKPTINTFYVINGGSISEQAKRNFFASTRPKYGDNARLIDGKALIQLDNSVASVSLQQAKSTLTGLLLEIQLNRKIISGISPKITKHIQEEGPYPIGRPGIQAVSAFLQQPQAYLVSAISLLQKYAQVVSMFNHLVDSVDIPISGGDYRRARCEGAVEMGRDVIATGNELLVQVKAQLNKLGPLVLP